MGDGRTNIVRHVDRRQQRPLLVARGTDAALLARERYEQHLLPHSPRWKKASAVYPVLLGADGIETMEFCPFFGKVICLDEFSRRNIVKPHRSIGSETGLEIGSIGSKPQNGVDRQRAKSLPFLSRRKIEENRFPAVRGDQNRIVAWVNHIAEGPTQCVVSGERSPCLGIGPNDRRAWFPTRSEAGAVSNKPSCPN